MSVRVINATGGALKTGLVLALATGAAAQPLTIYEIQSNTTDGDSSVYNYQVVDCSGGICTSKSPGSRPRLVLQDPAHPDGWGAIQIKDWTNGDLVDNVEIGDWVSLTNVLVEEYRGTTFLQWQTAYEPGYEIESQGNELPEPTLVSVDEIAAPLYDPELDGWYVENHDAEPYESMRLYVQDVTVTDMDLGKAADNYALENPTGESCWASDYMNSDAYPQDYHPFVKIGQHFCEVGGVLEQYTRLSTGWDYYQLLTQSTADFSLLGDVDHDGDVDLADLARLLASYGMAGGASFEDGDFDYDGDVDLADLAALLSVYGTIYP